MSGFVSFVGSGPGDPELLTLKAVHRLEGQQFVTCLLYTSDAADE